MAVKWFRNWLFGFYRLPICFKEDAEGTFLGLHREVMRIRESAFNSREQITLTYYDALERKNRTEYWKWVIARGLDSSLPKFLKNKLHLFFERLIPEYNELLKKALSVFSGDINKLSVAVKQGKCKRKRVKNFLEKRDAILEKCDVLLNDLKTAYQKLAKREENHKRTGTIIQIISTIALILTLIFTYQFSVDNLNLQKEIYYKTATPTDPTLRIKLIGTTSFNAQNVASEVGKQLISFYIENIGIRSTGPVHIRIKEPDWLRSGWEYIPELTSGNYTYKDVSLLLKGCDVKDCSSNDVPTVGPQNITLQVKCTRCVEDFSKSFDICIWRGNSTICKNYED